MATRLVSAEHVGSASQKETICVVIPVYNVIDYLQRCINSLLIQTRPADEIILVDDGSTDGSSSLCDSLSEKYDEIRVIHQANGGLSAARNTGIKASTCDLITFIDSDDWVSQDFLARLYSTRVETGADIVMCGMRRASSPEEFSRTARHSSNCEVYTQKSFIEMILRIKQNRCVHYACAKLYCRHTLVDDQYPVGILNEDVEGTFKAVLKADSVAEIDDELYCYFVNPDSITGSKFGPNYLNLVDVWTRVFAYSQANAPEYSDDVYVNVIRSDFTILCDSLVHGDSDTDYRYNDELNKSLERLRLNERELMNSRIVAGRKAAIAIVSRLYIPIRACLRFVQRIGIMK